MRLILRSLLWSLFLLPLVLIGLVWASLDASPVVEKVPALSHQDLERARKIVAAHDPRRLKAGERYSLALDAKDLNLAANYLLKRYGEGGVHFSPEEGMLVMRASLHLPENPLNPYLNLNLVLVEEEGAARIAGLRLGQVPVPGRWVEFALDQALQQTLHREDYQLFGDVIRELNIVDGRLRVLYEWNPELISRVPARLVSRDERERLQRYYGKLVEVSRQPDLGRRLSLLDIMQPLFRLAQERSQRGDPIGENRAAILVVAAFVTENGVEVLGLNDGTQPAPRPLIPTLERRQDFAEHFILSAALAAAGDVVLADAVGLYKELSDAKGRSGFSFTDLAAGRAGTRFGEVATLSTTSARQAQELLIQPLVETDIMPLARDLPEHMNQSEFQRRFGHIDSPAYQQLRQEIDRRIAACRLYQRF
jgi:hypothetical protein